MVVDDEIALTELFEISFEDSFNVITANNYEQFQLNLKNENIILVICDYIIERVNGVQMLTEVKEKYPLVRRVVISGQIDVQGVMDSINDAEVHSVIKKPFELSDVRKVINQQIKLYEKSRDDQEKLTLANLNLKSLREKSITQNDILLNLMLDLSSDNQIGDFTENLFTTLRGMKSISELYFRLYLDTNDENALSELFRYLSDIELISNQYHQNLVRIYILTIRAFLNLKLGIKDESFQNFETAKMNYYWFDKRNRQENLSEILDDYPYSTTNSFNIKTNEEIHSLSVENLHKLFILDIADLIIIEENLFRSYSTIPSSVYFLTILKGELPIFTYTPLNQELNGTLISAFVVALTAFLEELLGKTGKLETIQHTEGVILCQTEDDRTYLLFSHKNDTYVRLGLRQYIHIVNHKIENIHRGTVVSGELRQSLIEEFHKIFHKQ